MDPIIRFAKILVDGAGDDSGVDRDTYHNELERLAKAERLPTETIAQSYTRLATTTEKGALLFKAARLAPAAKKPVQAAQDFKPEPAGEASRELNDLAAGLATAKEISFASAHAQLQMDPRHKDLVARVRAEEQDVTARVAAQRKPITDAARQFSR
jgi:hypothetical protein